MVNPDSLYLAFKQTYGSCVLASFASALHHFENDVTPEKLFETFCLKIDANLKTNPPNNWEEEAANLFDQEWKKLGISGNKVVEDFFYTSEDIVLENCRKNIKVEWIEVSNELKDFTNKKSVMSILKDEDALLVASYQESERVAHSVAIGFHEINKVFFLSDTRYPFGHFHFPDDKFKTLGDGLLLTKI